MSNNTTLNSMTGGDVIQTVDNTTYKTPVTVLADSTGASMVGVSIDSSNNFLLATGTPAINVVSNFTAAGQSNSLNPCGPLSTCYVQITGTWAGTIVFEGSVDGVNFFSVNALPPTTSTPVTSTTANGQWVVDIAGLNVFRARHSVHTSGTAAVTLDGSTGVSLIGLDTPLPAGTNLIGAVNVSQLNGGALLTGGLTGTLAVGGTTAAGSTAAANPLRLGGTARTANPTAVTDGQVSNIMTDKMGRLVVVQGHARDLVATQATTITSSTTATTVVTAPGASVFADLTHLTITNGSATATTVTLSDGTKSYVYNVPGGGGLTTNFNPPKPATTANVAWTAACGTSVASIYINAVYVKNS